MSFKNTLKQAGIDNGMITDWLWLNFEGIKENPELKKLIAPFPPQELMYIVSGLRNEIDFAAHGVHIYKALMQVSPVAWSSFKTVLDLACGCGRIARIFKDHDIELHGLDIDNKLISWIIDNLKFVKGKITKPDLPLPYSNNYFDCVYSISLFTHVTQEYQDYLLGELMRITKPQGYIFLTIHGNRALDRALNEEVIFKMLSISRKSLKRASIEFNEGKHSFILQQGHLTTEKYQYGITFIPEKYINTNWSKWFEVVKVHPGAIHDFQDIVVLRSR